MKKMLITREQLDTLGTDRLLRFCYEQLSLSGEDSDALKFTSAFIQFVEERLTRQLIELLVTRGFATISNRPDVIVSLIRDSDFTKKINVIENIDKQRFATLVVFLRNMNVLRNQAFHAKFSSLRYREKPVGDVATQRDIVFDYIKAVNECINKTPTKST